MGIRHTLYSSSAIDFRKFFVHLFVIFLGFVPNIQSTEAFSVAILVQVVCNVDNYWDLISDRNVCKPLRTMSKVLVGLSVVGILLVVFNLMEPTNVYENERYGLFLKGFSLFVAVFPIGILVKDYKINSRFEEREEHAKLEKMKEGDEDEL